jgi:hypothetical protein
MKAEVISNLGVGHRHCAQHVVLVGVGLRVVPEPVLVHVFLSVPKLRGDLTRQHHPHKIVQRSSAEALHILRVPGRESAPELMLRPGHVGLRCSLQPVCHHVDVVEVHGPSLGTRSLARDSRTCWFPPSAPVRSTRHLRHIGVKRDPID